MTLIGVIVGLVVAVKLGQMQRHMEQTQAQLSQGVQQTLNSIKLPPGLENFFKTGSSMSDVSLMQPGISAIQPDVHQANDDNDGEEPYETRKACPSKCLKKDFVNPPLVILSMDGFSREYLDRFDMKSLSYITRCGATAERVFPPFPSRTFPSHYTIVTGLYPESHGIVDNNVYDPKISDKLESMKKSQLDGFYLGDPIWNIYKRHGGRTACLFWPGCGFNISGMRPDISPPYNKDLPFRNRFDMIVDWLLLSKDARPGLITAYLDQPDSAGHYQVDDRDIRNELVSLDDRLQYLIDRLETEGLLSCVNLVLLSDHGMQKTNNTVYFSKLLNDSRVLTAPGVIGRVHQFNSDATTDELSKPFACEKGDRWKVYDRASIPTRKHYQKTPRVGDVIVQGEPGTTFYADPSRDWHLSGDHGYDYINPSMQTVFFAMGPSIKRSSVLPAFQNIEYLNLWMDLLGLPQNVPNNGTLGVMDAIQSRPPLRIPELRLPMLECVGIGLAIASGCSSCTVEELIRINSRLSCAKPMLSPFEASSKGFGCFQNYCEKTVIVGAGKEPAVAVSETLVKGQVGSVGSCSFLNAKYGGVCSNRTHPPGYTVKSLSADEQSELSNISTLAIPWKSRFVTEVLKPLDEYTRSVVERMGRLVSVTGTAFDHNYDGIADAETNSSPSHLYRVLIACMGVWSSDGASCVQPTDTMVLAFILPHMDGDTNCLRKHDLLLDYTARLLDVELISGLQFRFPRLSHEQNLRLKTHIKTRVW